MIHGYDDATLNEHGLKQMREVSISASPASLRALAAFMTSAAEELESGPVHANWHRHIPNELRCEIGCDVVVLAPASE